MKECNHNETVWLGKTECTELGEMVRWCRKCGALKYLKPDVGQVVLHSIATSQTPSDEEPSR